MTTVLLSRDREMGVKCAKEFQRKGQRVYLCHRAEAVRDTLKTAFRFDSRAVVVLYAKDEADREYWQDAVDGPVRKNWIKIG